MYRIVFPLQLIEFSFSRTHDRQLRIEIVIWWWQINVTPCVLIRLCSTIAFQYNDRNVSVQSGTPNRYYDLRTISIYCSGFTCNVLSLYRFESGCVSVSRPFGLDRRASLPLKWGHRGKSEYTDSIRSSEWADKIDPVKRILFSEYMNFIVEIRNIVNI